MTDLAFKGGQPDAAEVDESVVIPDDAKGLEDLMKDPAAWAKVTKNGAALADFIDKMAQLRISKHKDVQAQVNDQVDRRWAQFLKEHEELGAAPLNMGDRRPDLAEANTATARAGLYNPRAMGAVLDSEFDGSGDFFKTIWHGNRQNPEAHSRRQRARNAFTSEVPSQGGFLVPENLRSQLLAVALESAIVRPNAFVVPMETSRVPFPTIDSTSNVDSVYGGIVAYWTEEGASLTESAAEFGRTTLDAKKLTTYATVPNELVSDSIISFEAFINRAFPEAMSWYEDIAFIKGTGVGEPLGALTTANDALITVPKEAAQAADTILWENIVAMYSRMLPASLNRAVWIVSPDTFPELATMALNVGTGGSAIWLTNGAEGPPMTILGRPVVVSEKTPGILGDQGDISFVDWNYYLVGDRQAMSAMSSEHYRFANDETAFRIISRVDGRPWLQSDITPENGGPTLSPFVQLAERA